MIDMDKKEFEVEVVCRQRAYYRVQAVDGDAAAEAAIERWRRGEPGDTPAHTPCELVAATASEASDVLRQTQDDELILRYVREREHLLVRLGGSMLNSAANDAISAQQAATDLGWYREDAAGLPTADSVRAAGSLERLCAAKRLVCFERPRARAGERGSIRLYCTADYLEALSEILSPEPPGISA